MSFNFCSSRLSKIRKSFTKANRGQIQKLDKHHQLMMSLSDQKPNRNSSFNHSMMPSVKSKLIKNFGRTKEKILQGMGKTDRTSDENFDVYVQNFESQHAQANKLSKELNKYLNCLRETQKSSKAFYDTLRETYEADWPASDLFAEQIEHLEIKWAEYLAKLHTDVQLPLISYLNEFPEHKKKIEKRYNRLLDYDNARHTLQNAEHKTSKKIGQNAHSTINNTSAGSSSSSSSTASNNHATTDQLTKLTKLKIDLEDKQHVYEDLNQTLCLALPVLYENRLKFYSSMFQTFFHTETTFHSDCVEAKSKLDDICEKLSIETSQMRTEQAVEMDSEIEHNLPPIDSDPTDNNDYSTDENELDNSPKTNSITEFAPNLNSEPVSGVRPVEQSTSMIYSYLVDRISETSQDERRIQSEKFLYKVKATYRYDPKEIDELAFDKEDVIAVVDGTESEKEDLDEGWLIGIHELSNKRGLFPENFTKKI